MKSAYEGSLEKYYESDDIL